MKDFLARILKNPFVAALVAGTAGLLLGLLWAWRIDPIDVVNATPAILRADLQDDYLRMAIESFQVNADPDLAVRRWNELGVSAPFVLQRVKDNPGRVDPRAIAIYEQVIEFYLGPEATAVTGEPPPEEGGSTALVVISVAGILILAVVIAGVFVFLRRLMRRPSSGVVTPAMQGVFISRQAERTDFESMGLAPPITQTMTAYVLGDDLYDESFSIDSPGGEFLGEYGVGISDTIGVGDPKKVTALEIWLFDKNDIKTATKVLMSEHAYQDMAIRARLEAKGELVLIEPGQQIMLETAALQLLATVVDLDYGSGPLPPSSYFERVTLELAVWPRAEQ